MIGLTVVLAACAAAAFAATVVIGIRCIDSMVWTFVAIWGGSAATTMFVVAALFSGGLI